MHRFLLLTRMIDTGMQYVSNLLCLIDTTTMENSLVVFYLNFEKQITIDVPYKRAKSNIYS